MTSFCGIDGKGNKNSARWRSAAGNSGEGSGGQAKLPTEVRRTSMSFSGLNADAARGTPTMTQMWNGEVTLKNVPVTYRP